MRLVAQKIEAECYNMFDKVVDKDYRAKLRDLVFNLKDKRNKELRERLLRKELSPEKVSFLKRKKNYLKSKLCKDIVDKFVCLMV